MATIELTPQLTQVLKTISAAPRPLSAYDILDQLRRTGIKSPPTVYRALEKLSALGLIHRIESLNAYAACTHDHAKTPHAASQFAICTECGEVEELAAPAQTKAASGFLASVSRRVLELSGVCRSCAGKEAH